LSRFLPEELFFREEGGKMRFSAGVGRRLAALGLTVSLSGVPLCLGQTLRGAGTLTGRIFVADGVTPRVGVVVKAANLDTSQIFSSGRTDTAGRYALSDLPAGRYQVAVESREGLYVNEDRVPVLQGRKTLFSLALNPATAQEPPPENPPPDNPPPDNPPPENPPPQAPPPEQPPSEQPPAEKPAEKAPLAEENGKKKEKTPAEQEAEKKKKKEGGFWRSGWGVATGIGGGAIVLGLLADSIAGETKEVKPVSSSSP
jgi:hypothetical protein